MYRRNISLQFPGEKINFLEFVNYLNVKEFDHVVYWCILCVLSLSLFDLCLHKKMHFDKNAVNHNLNWIFVFLCWIFSFCILFLEAPSISMLFSVFSHHSAFHLFANMYVLWSFCPSIVPFLGKEQFLATYITAG